MSGSGSGCYYRGSSRLTCEEAKRIDIRFLRKQNMLRPDTAGRLAWNIGGEPTGDIRYAMYDRTMVLKYRFRRYSEADWEDVQQTIWFDRTPCYYGGERKWFLCPRCDARVAILYGVDKFFYCRHCYQLPYSSQGEDYLNRMSRKLNKLGEKLEAEDYVSDGEFWKPKGMHWRTFYQLKAAEIEMDDRLNGAVLARFRHYL